MVSTPLIRVPNKPDLRALTYGDTDKFTPDTLHYLRHRDDKAGFIINVMTDDATRNGPVYETPEDQERGEPYEAMLQEASRQNREFGWNVILHLDGAEPELTKNILDQSIDIFLMHPFVEGVGGIEDYEDDEVTGFPTVWKVKWTPKSTNQAPVNVERTDIWKGQYAGNWWQGYSAISNSYDDIVSLRLWRSTSMRRLRDYATVRYIIQLLALAGQPEVPSALRTAIKESFSTDDGELVIPHVVVPGEVKVETVGGPVQPEELGITTDKAEKGASVGTGVSAADMTGAEAGQKLSVDANQATYAYALKDIQKHLFPLWKKTFERLGVKITGFKSPSELPPAEKYEILEKLNTIYDSGSPSTKEAYGELLENFLKSEFNIEIEIDAASDLEYNEQQFNDLLGGNENGKNESGDSGGTGATQGQDGGNRKGRKGRGSKEKGG